jgi:hypothetical protein
LEGHGATLAVLRRVTALGYTVSVFRFPSSLLGTWPACVEMHALGWSCDPPVKHVARIVVGVCGEPDLRCAELLAVMISRAADPP